MTNVDRTSMSRGTFLVLVAALWLGNIVPAMDATLVGTALPTVIGSLDGISLYSWVFAAYLLALTISIPIFGKLIDIFGRKPIYFAGMGLFTLGAVASSLAQNVEQLIACRVLIGVATGAIQPAAMTIMGDAIPIERRAKIQWVFASAWFLSSAIGPAIASVITNYLSWRFVFLTTVPLGLIASYLMATHYDEQAERVTHRIDMRGILLLGGGVLALLFALSPTNRSAGIDFTSGGVLLAVAAVLIALFLWNETRAAEPVLPPRLFLVPVLGIAALGSVASGISQSGAQSFIPMFVQGGQGGTVSDVGFVLPWLTIGWPIGAGLGGFLLLRFGFRRTVIAGMALIVAAQAGFLMLDRDSSPALAAGAMALMGLGFGFSSVSFTISVQSSVVWGDRGVATASLQFFRSIGGSVGVAIMGTIVGLRMQPLLEQYELNSGSGNASALLDPAARDAMAPEVLAALQLGMTGAIHDAFYVMVAAAVIGLVCVFWFPKSLPTTSQPADEPQPADSAEPQQPVGATR